MNTTDLKLAGLYAQMTPAQQRALPAHVQDRMRRAVQNVNAEMKADPEGSRNQARKQAAEARRQRRRNRRKGEG